MRTPDEWAAYCKQHITAGYVHDGNRAGMFAAGQALAAQIGLALQWKAGDVLVDVGCGNGRLAMGVLDLGLVYHGIDIVKGSINFCRKAFSGYPNFTFYHIDVASSRYWPNGTVKPERAIYPLPDSMADFVVANSLFTHTGTVQVAMRNLAEMLRVLKPGGLAYTTWNIGQHVAKEKRTEYTRQQIEAMLAGLEHKALPRVDKGHGQTPILIWKPS